MSVGHIVCGYYEFPHKSLPHLERTYGEQRAQARANTESPLPKVKAYAADFSMGESDEEFIGVTSSLELAQVWKKKSEVRGAIGKYLEFLIEEFDDTSKIELGIRKLKRLSNGKLKDEPARRFII